MRRPTARNVADALRASQFVISLVVFIVLLGLVVLALCTRIEVILYYGLAGVLVVMSVLMLLEFAEDRCKERIEEQTRDECSRLMHKSVDESFQRAGESDGQGKKDQSSEDDRPVV
jgi:protein-S-isoprenylcysteine O-methyltransferase Ste14